MIVFELRDSFETLDIVPVETIHFFLSYCHRSRFTNQSHYDKIDENEYKLTKINSS